MSFGLSEMKIGGFTASEWIIIGRFFKKGRQNLEYCIENYLEGKYGKKQPLWMKEIIEVIENNENYKCGT